MKATGVVLTQPPIPQGTSGQSSGATPEFLLLIMSEGGQGWERCQLGRQYLDPKGLLSDQGTQDPSAPPLCMHHGPSKRKGSLGQGPDRNYWFWFDFVFSVF